MKDKRLGTLSRAIKVAIVGLGVRGLTILERLVAAGRTGALPTEVVIEIFDTGAKPNYGESQPDYLLLNIMCGQTSCFPDPVSVKHFPATSGPSLFDWVRELGLGFAEDGMTVLPGGAGEITPQSFLPRRLMGEYIEHAFSLLTKALPAGLRVQRLRHAVVGIERGEGSFHLRTDDGAFDADYLFLTVGGYSKLTPGDVGLAAKVTPSSATGVVSPILPLPDTLSEICAGDVVAVAGMGLSGIDVVASLTLGRGGSFGRDDWHSEYRASGEEPHIVLYSRSGLPYRSRPRVPRAKPYTPVVFTRQRIGSLVEERRGEIDFESDVLPWLFAEMALAAAFDLSDEWGTRFAGATNAGEMLAEVQEMSQVPFDPRAEYFGRLETSLPDAFADGPSYQDAAVAFIERDLVEAWAGTEQSATKFALELCRDLRDVIRLGVDQFVLTPQSQIDFFSQHRSLIDRIVVGPQLERSADLVALVRAGVVSISLGPSPRVTPGGSRRWRLHSTELGHAVEVDADWLVESHAQGRPDDPATRLLATLFEDGFLSSELRSPVANAVAMDRDGVPRDVAGQPIPGCWVFGLASEGSTYYNNYVMSPGKYVKGFADADNAVWQLSSSEKS